VYGALYNGWITTPAPKKRGRPRAFDVEAALDTAMHEFWQHGYDSTSISGLTEAMGIRPPSLYAAFGDKRALFGEVLDRYNATHGGPVMRALTEEPTARAAVQQLLHVVAGQYTDASHPPGCLVINATARSADGAAVAQQLCEARAGLTQAIAERIAGDVASGRLPADLDVGGLAAFYLASMQGMSRQAQDGATRDELERVATCAIGAWPASG
jgi:AcrR family transcriptional regulator